MSPSSASFSPLSPRNALQRPFLKTPAAIWRSSSTATKPWRPASAPPCDHGAKEFAMRRIVPALLAVTQLALAVTPAEKLVKQVQDKVRRLQPTPAEKKIDEVGWAPTIADALLL